jgi:hypothetical protein
LEDLAGKLASQLTPQATAAGGLDLNRLGALLEGSGIDMNAMQQLVGEVETALARDPAATAALAERLFGAQLGHDAADKDDDENDG